MYTKIMVPVDLAHIDKLGKAIGSATDSGRGSFAKLATRRPKTKGDQR